jgi:hypothetical protein
MKDYPKLICLQDILTKEELAEFLEMLAKQWPKVYDAWITNTERLAKFEASVGEK